MALVIKFAEVGVVIAPLRYVHSSHALYARVADPRLPVFKAHAVNEAVPGKQLMTAFSGVTANINCADPRIIAISVGCAVPRHVRGGSVSATTMEYQGAEDGSA
jgi:hypothetical protein